jgi:external thioesterase TEII
MDKKQIFLLHFAGGNQFSYRFLMQYLSKEFECHCLELPGRGKRLNEALIHDFQDAVLDMYNQMKCLRNSQDYAIYGHSMGAIFALYLAEKLEASHDVPKKLLVTGSSGPNRGLDGKRHQLNEEDFMEELRSLGGIPDEALMYPEIFHFFAPILRADFELLEAMKLPDIGIKSNVKAIMGSEEKFVDYLGDWSNLTTGAVETATLSGGHFFILDHPKSIAEEMNRLL